MSPREGKHMKVHGWIGVDLDGTLATYDKWRGIEHIGEPIAPMIERVKRWLTDGNEVRIFTARVDGGLGGKEAEDVAAVRHHVEQWCLKNIGIILPVTNVKDFGMAELWDDRAVQVEANTGRMLGYSPRGLEPTP
jgi:hypothetical protein